MRNADDLGTPDGECWAKLIAGGASNERRAMSGVVLSSLGTRSTRLKVDVQAFADPRDLVLGQHSILHARLGRADAFRAQPSLPDTYTSPAQSRSKYPQLQPKTVNIQTVASESTHLGGGPSSTATAAQ